MKNKRKIFYLFTILLSLSSCKQTEKVPSQILHLNLSDDPSSLDPRTVRSLKDLTIAKQLFDGLMRLDKAGRPQPAVAEKVSISDDLLTYIFHLRHTRWNNQDPVTAYDFEHAWKEILTPHFASDYSYMLYPIKNAQNARLGKCSSEQVAVTALDNHTLVVQLATPTPYFLELLAFPTYFPVNKSQKNFNEKSKLICNGPFCLKDWKPQQKMTLVKNHLYWDQEKVSLNQIDLSIISDNNTESYLFEKEELDWLGQPISNNITPELLQKLKKEGKLQSYPIAGTYWFKYNTLKTPFHDVNVRKAFAYAINREEIITHILQGNQTSATGPIPPSMSLQKAPYFEDGNATFAKKCLENAFQDHGWTPDNFPKIVLSYPPSERNTKIVQYAQQKWKEILGIQVELQAVENQLYRRNARSGKYQIGTGEWIADFNDPLAFLELFKDLNDAITGNGMNDTNWHHVQFTQLLEASLLEANELKRKQLLLEAEQILVDEMPIAPLYHYAFDYVKKPYIQNVVLSPLGIADFKETRIAR